MDYAITHMGDDDPQQKPVRLSSEFNMLAEEAITAEMATGPPATLKEYYIRCFEQARDDGVPKHQICRVVRNRLNQIKARKVRRTDPDAPYAKCIINTGWYDKCARACGYTDPAMARHVKKKDTDILGYQANTSPGTGEGNAAVMARVGAMREICTLLMARIRGLPNDSEGLLEAYDEKERRALLAQWDASISAAASMIDAKTKVPVPAQLMLLHSLDIEGSIQRAVIEYYRRRLRRYEAIVAESGGKVGQLLTRKQAGAIQAGDVRRLSPLLAPHDRDDAIFKGYVGQPCGPCGSWRTTPAAGTLHSLACLDCGTRATITSVKQCPECLSLLYSEDLARVRRTGKCPAEGCGMPVMLPPGMEAPPRP